MRTFLALILAVIFSAGAAAQAQPAKPAAPNPSPLKPIIIPTQGALGGPLNSAPTRPLGGVALPTFPASSARPHRPKPAASGIRYVGPVYFVPNAYDVPAPAPSSSEDYSVPPAPAPQPVIINQYFTATPVPASVPIEPAVEQPASFLIAYKDHTVYSALTYWIEGDTFHYVTTKNTHNQASLALIDLDQTVKLNSGKTP